MKKLFFAMIIAAIFPLLTFAQAISPINLNHQDGVYKNNKVELFKSTKLINENDLNPRLMNMFGYVKVVEGGTGIFGHYGNMTPMVYDPSSNSIVFSFNEWGYEAQADTKMTGWLYLILF